jgi:aspartate/methionine/tyrosine aminotransferase
MVRVSQRSSISPFFAMKMGELAQEIEQELAAGEHVLHLEVGQPSAGASQRARRAAADAILNHGLGYTNSGGLLELRRRIAQHYRDWYDQEVSAQNVLIVSGASAGFVLTFLACFDVGSRVAVTEPGYPCYRNTLQALGCEPIGIPLGPDTGYRLTASAIARTMAEDGPLDGLVIASPSNPTGTILWDSDLAEIVELCSQNNIQLVADEIYHGITYGHSAPTILAHSNDAVVLNSFSKYFGMTGWRLGWIVAPTSLVSAMERFAQNLYLCAPHVSQIAGIASFDSHDELEQQVTEFAKKRNVLLAGLDACGLSYAPADGAFYAYVDVSHLTDDSWTLAKTWLEELHVAATPGIDFDPVRGKQFVRFSCAGEIEDIAKAMRRIREWITARP